MDAHRLDALLHLLRVARLDGVEPADAADVAAGKPVVLRFSKPSIIGGTTTFWTGPVSRELADEALAIAGASPR